MGEEYVIRIWGPKWGVIALLVFTIAMTVIGSVTFGQWVFG